MKNCWKLQKLTEKLSLRIYSIFDLNWFWIAISSIFSSILFHIFLTSHSSVAVVPFFTYTAWAFTKINGPTGKIKNEKYYRVAGINGAWSWVVFYLLLIPFLFFTVWRRNLLLRDFYWIWSCSKWNPMNYYR